MNKKRILFCTESSHIQSGFGNFSRSIISRLHKEGYDVAELSCYRTYNEKKAEPWKIYPAALPKDHPNYHEYIKDINNQFGGFMFNFALLDYQPDIVIDFRDFWMFTYQEISPLRPFYHWIVAPTIDSAPILLNATINIGNADTVLTHTQWASDQLKNLDKNKRMSISGILSDSVDTDIFKPINNTREIYGIDDQAFIIGSVLRNQKRKLIPDLLDITRAIIRNNPDKSIYLYLHTSYPEINGWNLPELLLEYELLNHVLLTYKCGRCGDVAVKTFQYKSICSKCGSNSHLINVQHGITPEQLCQIYNLFDVYIQYAICEGFGIPQVEAVACGLPMITINHGAMSEIGHSLNAYVVDIERSFRDSDTNAIRVYPNNQQTIDIIQQLLLKTKTERQQIGDQSRRLLLQLYSWDITTQNLKNIIDNIQLVGLQGKWDHPLRETVNSNTINFDGNHYEFMRHIVTNLICDEFLMNTSYIQNTIYNLDNGYITTDTGRQPYTIHQAIEAMNAYSQQKIFLEKIRTKQLQIPNALDKNINYE